MAEQSFPDPVFESILEKLVRTIEITQRSESTLNSQARQALFQSTTEVKEGLAKAKRLANSLPGGELLIEEQNEVIDMLEKLRDLKQAQIGSFSTRALSTTMAIDESTKMEIDSTASSPHE